MSFVHPSSLEEAVQDKSLIRTGAFVADQWVQGDKTFSVFDPEIGNPIAQIADVGHDDILKAIAYAKAGFDSFRKTSEILTMENGKTLADAEVEVEPGASFFDWFADEVI
ncbi:hypothetical protein ACJ41O_015388 [Fusarium nematophilum]